MSREELEIFDWGITLISNDYIKQKNYIILKDLNKIIINKWLFRLIKDDIVNYTEILKLKLTLIKQNG